MDFTAIDFETATVKRDSACAVGIVSVASDRIVDSFFSLIKPPNNYYWSKFTDIHGIAPEDTLNAPTFEEIYPTLRLLLGGRQLVAHNAPFDRGVLHAGMVRAHKNVDDLSLRGWECTLRISRTMGFAPCTLDACCERYGIDLNHHHALSDATACAELFMKVSAACVE